MSDGKKDQFGELFRLKLFSGEKTSKQQEGNSMSILIGKQDTCPNRHVLCLRFSSDAGDSYHTT
jgi:hypothetical protein